MSCPSARRTVVTAGTVSFPSILSHSAPRCRRRAQEKRCCIPFVLERAALIYCPVFDLRHRLCPTTTQPQNGGLSPQMQLVQPSKPRALIFLCPVALRCVSLGMRSVFFNPPLVPLLKFRNDIGWYLVGEPGSPLLKLHLGVMTMAMVSVPLKMCEGV